MSRKRVIFFLPNLASGGAERVTINFLNQLSREQYDIHLVLGTSKGDSPHLAPTDVQIHDLKSQKTMFSIFKMRRVIKEIKPYAIFSSLNRINIALYLSLLGVKNKPKIILRYPNSPKLLIENNTMGKGFKFLLDIALQNANLIIAQTPEMKKELNLFHSIEESKINVIINPFNQKEIDIKSQESLDLFDNKYINIVASGRLSYQKGYDVLLDAFQKVFIQNSKFRLFIIGADTENKKGYYEELSKKLNIDSVVTFLGFQENPYKFYKNCDLYVLSSRWEGLPNTVLENLYLKKNIISTRCIPFLTTLIENKVNGFLVDIEDSDQLATAILDFKEITGEKGFLTNEYNTNIDIFERLEI